MMLPQRRGGVTWAVVHFTLMAREAIFVKWTTRRS